jgi:hypothetical protein
LDQASFPSCRMSIKMTVLPGFDYSFLNNCMLCFIIIEQFQIIGYNKQYEAITLKWLNHII